MLLHPTNAGTACLALAAVSLGGLAPMDDPLHELLDVDLARDGASLVSEVLVPEAEFTAALPSWNVAGRTPFTVDVRVSAEAEGDEWSPWLRIGDWGIDRRTEDVVVEFEGGKVAIDVLDLKAPQRRAQLRFEPARKSKRLSASDVRAHIVLSDLRRIDARMSAAAEEPWPDAIQLDVPTRSQRRAGDDIGGRICSPTSVAMVVSYHGVSVPTRKMAETLLDPHHGIYGNWNRAVQGAYSHGIPGQLVRVSSWSTVRAYLAEGRPLIASIRAKKGELTGAPYASTGGHLLVVTGLDADGVVLVNDPAASSPDEVPRRYLRSEMERVWFRNGGVVYALDAPDTKERRDR